MSIKRKKAEQLGMDPGTATNRLHRRLMFSYAQRLGETICFRCQELILTADDAHVDHKVPWLDVSPDLFWDLDNLAWSHARCNITAGRRPTRQEWTEELRRCTKCKQFRPYSDWQPSKQQDRSAYCRPCANEARARQRQAAGLAGRPGSNAVRQPGVLETIPATVDERVRLAIESYPWPAPQPFTRRKPKP